MTSYSGENFIFRVSKIDMINSKEAFNKGKIITRQ